MNKRDTTIALNGRVYDVKTGRPLSGGTSRTPQHATYTRAKAVDGFMRSPITLSPSAPTKTHSSSTPKVSTKLHQKAPGAHKIHQKKSKTRTLVRSSVQKPAPSKIHGVKTNSKSIGEAVQSVLHQQQLHEKRLDNAKKIPKSKSISKFSNGSNATISKKYSPNLVVQPNPISATTSLNDNLLFQHHSPSFSMTQSAMNNAVSHQQTPAKRRSKKLGFRRKSLNIGAISAIVVIIASFTAIHNSANLAIKTAANRSGVTGSLPSYKPDGFSLSPLRYARGQIVLTYKANSDSSRTYSITQTNSDWNNSDLEQRYLSANQSTYQRYEYDNGVFYIHDNNATWIKDGTWYNLSSQAQLSNDQLLKVASSF